jgi:hypothetical protein
MPFSKWLPIYGIKKWAVKFQHCPISSKFDVEFLQYCGGHFEKGRPVEIFQCRESIQDIIIYPHIKF